MRVLKNWGLHPVDELAMLADMLERFAWQQLDGCSNPSSVLLDLLLQGHTRVQNVRL